MVLKCMVFHFVYYCNKLFQNLQNGHNNDYMYWMQTSNSFQTNLISVGMWIQAQCFNWSFIYHCMCSNMLPLVSPFRSGTQVVYMQVPYQNHFFQLPLLDRFKVDHKHLMNNYKHKYCNNPCHSINHLITCWKTPHGL